MSINQKVQQLRKRRKFKRDPIKVRWFDEMAPNGFSSFACIQKN